MRNKLNETQRRALNRLAELGSNPYGWTAGQLGSSGQTLSALCSMGLAYGGNIYGGRVRSYIIQDRGREYLAAQGMETGTAETRNEVPGEA